MRVAIKTVKDVVIIAEKEPRGTRRERSGTRREGRISSQRWGQCFKATADAVVVFTKGKTRDSCLR